MPADVIKLKATQRLRSHARISARTVYPGVVSWENLLSLRRQNAGRPIKYLLELQYPDSHRIKKTGTPAKLMYICTGGNRRKQGSKKLSKLLRNYADQYGLADIGIIKTHCTDKSKHTGHLSST